MPLAVRGCVEMDRYWQFDGDPIERESTRLTIEIAKTVVVILFGIVMLMVAGIVRI